MLERVQQAHLNDHREERSLGPAQLIRRRRNIHQTKQRRRDRQLAPGCLQRLESTTERTGKTARDTVEPGVHPVCEPSLFEIVHEIEQRRNHEQPATGRLLPLGFRQPVPGDHAEQRSEARPSDLRRTA
jgi:hypothetical protein